jgi:hypothetical protein
LYYWRHDYDNLLLLPDDEYAFGSDPFFGANSPERIICMFTPCIGFYDYSFIGIVD